MSELSIKLFLYLVIIISAIFHEYAHGWMAYRLGDPTAKNAGRLTLNPLSHIDPVGTVIVPLLLLFTSGIFFGWARPVPYNPQNLRDQKRGSLKVGFAGPATNLLIAFILGLLIRFSEFIGAFIPVPSISWEFLGLIVYVNIFIGLFNLIPLPPLDGSKIFADLFPRQWRGFMRLGIWGIVLAIFIAMFFIAPIAQIIFNLFTGRYF